MKGKHLWLAVLGLALLTALAGCGSENIADKQQLPASLIYEPEQQREDFVYGPEVQLAELTADETAGLSLGAEPRQVALTPELRAAFFDLGRLARWDFMYSWIFGDVETPRSEIINDYIFMIGAQAVAWQDYWRVDDERSMFTLPAAYVDEFMQVHFGYTVPHLEGWAKEVEFAGGEYIFYSDGWAYQPLYRLLSLTVAKENIGGANRVVYEATLREYKYYPPGISYELDDEFFSSPEGQRDMLGEARELLCGDEEPELPEGYFEAANFGGSIHRLRFYLNEQGQLVYLGMEHLEEL